MPNPTRIVVGRSYGELAVVSGPHKRAGVREWGCECSCGKKGIFLTSHRLVTRTYKACGHMTGRYPRTYERSRVYAALFREFGSAAKVARLCGVTRQSVQCGLRNYERYQRAYQK